VLPAPQLGQAVEKKNNTLGFELGTDTRPPSTVCAVKDPAAADELAAGGQAEPAQPGSWCSRRGQAPW